MYIRPLRIFVRFRRKDSFFTFGRLCSFQNGRLGCRQRNYKMNCPMAGSRLPWQPWLKHADVSMVTAMPRDVSPSGWGAATRESSGLEAVSYRNVLGIKEIFEREKIFEGSERILGGNRSIQSDNYWSFVYHEKGPIYTAWQWQYRLMLLIICTSDPQRMSLCWFIRSRDG